jgi:hypothetical protein
MLLQHGVGLGANLLRRQCANSFFVRAGHVRLLRF